MSSPNETSNVSNESGSSELSPISSTSLPSDSFHFEELINLKRKYSQILDQLKNSESINDNLVEETTSLSTRLEEEKRRTQYLQTKIDSLKEEIVKLKHDHEDQIEKFKNREIALIDVHRSTILKWMQVLEDINSIEMYMKEAENSSKLILTIVELLYRKKLKEDDKIDELIEKNIKLEKTITKLKKSLEKAQKQINMLSETIDVKNKSIDDLKRKDELKRLEDEQGESESEMLSPILLEYVMRAGDEHRDSSANSLMNELIGFQPLVHSTPSSRTFTRIYESAVSDSFFTMRSESTPSRDTTSTKSPQLRKEQMNLFRCNVFGILLGLFLLLALFVLILYWTQPPGISVWDPCLQRYSWTRFKMTLSAAIRRQKVFPS